jgi:hypothetical protein
VEVVRQNDPCINVKRPRCLDFGNGGAQRFYLANQDIVTAVTQIDREKIGGAGYAVAPVIGYCCRLVSFWRLAKAAGLDVAAADCAALIRPTR